MSYYNKVLASLKHFEIKQLKFKKPMLFLVPNTKHNMTNL